jgi:hypothetical protein
MFLTNLSILDAFEMSLNKRTMEEHKQRVKNMNEEFAKQKGVKKIKCSIRRNIPSRPKRKRRGPK